MDFAVQCGICFTDRRFQWIGSILRLRKKALKVINSQISALISELGS